MEINLNITLGSPEAVNALLAAWPQLIGGQAPVTPAQPTIMVGSTPVISEMVFPATAKRAVQPEPTQEVPTSTPGEDPVTPPEAPTYALEDVRAALMQLPTPDAKTLINSFGVPKLSLVPTNRYYEMMTRITEQMDRIAEQVAK